MCEQGTGTGLVRGDSLVDDRKLLESTYLKELYKLVESQSSDKKNKDEKSKFRLNSRCMAIVPLPNCEETDQCSCVRILPNGMVVVGTATGRLKIWNVEHDPMTTYAKRDIVEMISLSHNGTMYLAVLSGSEVEVLRKMRCPCF